MGNNFDDEDLIARMVTQKQKENKLKQVTDNYQTMTAEEKVKYSEQCRKTVRNVKNKSKKNNVTPIPTSKKQQSSRNTDAFSVKNFVAGLLVGATLMGIGTAKFIVPNAKDKEALERGTQILEEAAINKLAENGLGTYDENGEFILNGKNTADDYKKLDIDTDLEVFIYRYIASEHWNKEAGDNNQFDSIIEASLSSDNHSYHTSYGHFLSDGGYFNTQETREDGSLLTSDIVFTNYMESEIMDLYKSGTVSEYAKEAFGDYNTKGGITK